MHVRARRDSRMLSRPHQRVSTRTWTEVVVAESASRTALRNATYPDSEVGDCHVSRRDALQASMIGCENGRSCVPAATSRFNAAGLRASYLPGLLDVGEARGRGDDRLIVLRQRVPFCQIDHEVVGGAALPPARIVIVRRDLVEAELLVVVGADPLGRVDGAFLQRGIDVAAGDLLRHHAELLQRLAGPAADAELEALEIVDGLDLVAEPAAHLRPRVAARQRVDVELLAELVHQLQAVAIVVPRILLPGVEAERHRAEQRPGRVLADEVVGGGVADLDGAVLHGVEHLQARVRSRPPRTPESGTCCRSLRRRTWRRSRMCRRACRATSASSRSSAI